MSESVSILAGNDLVDLDLSALTSIGESSPGGYLGIDYNNALASVDLSALVTVEEALWVTYDPVLGSLDLSALTSVGWEFEINNNDLLGLLPKSVPLRLRGSCGLAANW